MIWYVLESGEVGDPSIPVRAPRAQKKKKRNLTIVLKENGSSGPCKASDRGCVCHCGVVAHTVRCCCFAALPLQTRAAHAQSIFVAGGGASSESSERRAHFLLRWLWHGTHTTYLCNISSPDLGLWSTEIVDLTSHDLDWIFLCGFISEPCLSLDVQPLTHATLYKCY